MTLQGYQLIAAHGKVSDADPPLLPDELGHGLQLLLTNVDKLSPIINDTSQETIRLQLSDSVNGLLCLQVKLGSQVL